MSNLERMTGHTRLYRRNATYYHRASVPKDIADTYGKVEETFSLGTKDKTEALRLVRIKAVEVDERFDRHRNELAKNAEPYLEELTEEQIKRFGDVYFAYLLEEDDETRLIGFDEFEEIAGERVWTTERPDTPRDTFEEHAAGIDSMLEHAKHDLARGKVDEFTKSEVEDVLSWDGLGYKLKDGSPSWLLLYRELNRSIKRASEALLERNKGNIVETPNTDSATRVQAPSASKHPLLSEAIDRWIKDSEHSWSPKTKSGNTTWVRSFLDICGDRTLDTYSKADGRLFKETFSNLPPNWRKLSELRELTILAASEKAIEMTLEPMSLENINKGIGKANSFWEWVDGHYFDDNAPRPLKGLKHRLKRTPRDERNPFSNGQLNKIFKTPVFMGCSSETHWKTKGTKILKESPKFWVPLIGLFTGARLAEICQLEVSDIKIDGAITYFDFNGALANERKAGQKGIKTANSQRKVPVHPTLIKVGFIEFLQRTKASGAVRLFPSIKIGADGSYSDHFSKHFRRFLDSCDAKTNKTSFHSFRHNFEDACGNAQITDDLRDTLQGHGSVGMRARYGSRKLPLNSLQDAINKIEYPDLDLSHLYS